MADLGTRLEQGLLRAAKLAQPGSEALRPGRAEENAATYGALSGIGIPAAGLAHAGASKLIQGVGKMSPDAAKALLSLPAVVAVKEGINLPRYPSVPGRLRARKKEIETVVLDPAAAAPARIRLRVPVEKESAVEILGEGPEAAPRVVDVLRRLGLIA
jgi:electron transfer flavoprotein beta subunit